MSIERSQRLTLSDLEKHPDPLLARMKQGFSGAAPRIERFKSDKPLHEIQTPASGRVRSKVIVPRSQREATNFDAHLDGIRYIGTET